MDTNEPDLEPQPFAADPTSPATAAPTPFGRGLTPQDRDWLAVHDQSAPLFQAHVGQGIEVLLREFRAAGYATKADARLDKLRGAITRYLTESQQ